MNFLITSQAVVPFKQPFAKKAVDFEPDNGKSYLGTPVYSFIEFPEGKYQTLEGNIISFDGCKLTAVLVEISQSKNIVITQIAGKNVSVKEYISDTDFDISVTGRIVNEANSIPQIALTAMKEICKVPDTLNVNCPFLQYFDITAVVIKDYTFSEVEGFRNTIDFSMVLLSDVPPINLEGEFINEIGTLNINQ